MEQWLEHEKFIQFVLNKRISNLSKKRLIRGSFKEEGSEKVISGDEFMAYEIQKGDALESYKCYIEYFNHTLRKGELKRIAVCAVWVNQED